MTAAKNRYIRYTTFSITLGLIVYLALGYGSHPFEAYCPFGGAESLWGLFTAGEFSCALGPLNLSLMLAMIQKIILRLVLSDRIRGRAFGTFGWTGLEKTAPGEIESQ
jgi:hypothetical protein